MVIGVICTNLAIVWETSLCDRIIIYYDPLFILNHYSPRLSIMIYYANALRTIVY